MKTLMYTVLTALLLVCATSCVVYDPYYYPEYGYAGPAYPYPAPPVVTIEPFFGLFAPWCFDGYYGYPGHYGSYRHYGGHYGGHYGYGHGGHGHH